MIIAVVIAIYCKQLQIDPKKFRDFNGIWTHGLCSALVLKSYEDLQWFLAVGINMIKTLKTC